MCQQACQHCRRPPEAVSRQPVATAGQRQRGAAGRLPPLMARTRDAVGRDLKPVLLCIGGSMALCRRVVRARTAAPAAFGAVLLPAGRLVPASAQPAPPVVGSGGRRIWRGSHVCAWTAGSGRLPLAAAGHSTRTRSRAHCWRSLLHSPHFAGAMTLATGVWWAAGMPVAVARCG